MLIIGLGNPGKEYEHTPHNVGFMAVDKIASVNNFTFGLSQKHKAMIAEGYIEGEKVTLMKPLTYMNLSGNAVRSYVEYYKIDINDIIIIYDDMDLPIGKIRIRKSGSSGGHNGIKSIIANLQTENFKRIRIGIGRPADATGVIDFVLHNLSKEETKILSDTINLTPEMIETVTKKGFDCMMNIYNGVK